jgi:hypothetical protein
VGRHATHAGRRAAAAAFGGLCGLVVSVIVVLNLHILVGLEEGYAASPSQVWDRSAVLAVLDVALFTAGPLLGALAAWKMLRQRPAPKSPTRS